jgi:hypothetical protein
MNLKLPFFLIIAFITLTKSISNFEGNSINYLKERTPISLNSDPANILNKRFVCGDICYGHIDYSYKGFAPCYPNCQCFCGICRCRYGICKCKDKKT